MFSNILFSELSLRMWKRYLKKMVSSEKFRILWPVSADVNALNLKGSYLYLFIRFSPGLGTLCGLSLPQARSSEQFQLTFMPDDHEPGPLMYVDIKAQTLEGMSIFF